MLHGPATYVGERTLSFPYIVGFSKVKQAIGLHLDFKVL